MGKYQSAAVVVLATLAMTGFCREVLGLGFWGTQAVTFVPGYFIVGWSMDKFGWPSWVRTWKSKR